MEEARSRGELRANSFLRLRKPKPSGKSILEVNDLGDAEILLKNSRHFSQAASELFKRGIMPTEDGWGGWLGKYQAALCKTIREIKERQERDLDRAREQDRDRSRGR